MKKFLAILLCIVMVMMCFGCGEDSKRGSDDGSDSDVSEKKTFETGTTSDDTYKNKYFDIKFNLPEGWYFYSREDIAAIAGMADEIFEGKEYDFEGNSSLIDMMAVSSSDTTNINISYEKSTVTLSKYISAVKTQLEGMSTDEYVIELADERDYKLAGEKYTLLEVDSTVYGVTMKQYELIRKEGSVFCVMSFTIVNNEYTLDELASYFK